MNAEFWHINDIDWTEVQRQQNADGSVSVVREKWPIIRPDFLSAYVHYEPGMVVRRHGHRSNHVVFVLDGDGWIGTEPCRQGTHIHVPLGSAFGPIIAGPQGLTSWELSFGEFGGWGDQPELYANEIAERQIVPLPDPPLDIGEWFVDPRGDWGGERPSPKIEGLQSVLTHIDEFKWVESGNFRQKNLIDLENFSSTLLELANNAQVQRTQPLGQRLIWIIRGEAEILGRSCPAGTHLEVPPTLPLGPITTSESGVELLELNDTSALQD